MTDGDAGRDVTSIEKIRELIFGPQMEEYQRRFDLLEDQLKATAAEMRSDLKQRLDDVQSSLKDEITALKQQLASERKDRGSSHDTVLKEVAEARKEHSGQLKKLEGRVTKAQQVRADELQARLVALEKDLAAKTEALRAAMDEGMDNLSESKLDRRALADAISQIVGRLVGGDAAD